MTGPSKKTLKDINDSLGDGGDQVVGYLRDNSSHGPAEAISTGCIQLDQATGIGGIPRGRIVEIFGPESSGKSTLVYNIFTEAQRNGGTAGLIDTEHSFDASYAQAIGMDTDALLISQPDYGEQGLEVVYRLVRDGGLDIIAVDSVAALLPKAQIEGQAGDSYVGLQARLMSQELRRLAPAAAKSKTSLVFTNQIRVNVSVQGYGGSPETQPGGKALRFYSAQRMDIRRIETVKHDNQATGIKCRVKMIKNKTAAPHREAIFEIDYGTGISKPGSLLDEGLRLEVVSQKGSYFYFGDTKLGQGRHATKENLRENLDLIKELETALEGGAG